MRMNIYSSSSTRLRVNQMFQCGVTNQQCSLRPLSHIVSCVDNSARSDDGGNNGKYTLCCAIEDSAVDMEAALKKEAQEPRSFLVELNDDLRDPSVHKAVAVELMAQVRLFPSVVLPQSYRRLEQA